MKKIIEENYLRAKEAYAAIGVDTEAALTAAAATPVSLHCWQGDDVLGFEGTGEGLSGGIQATGNYPGRARSLAELRADIDKTLTLVPGTNRINIHANYLDNQGKTVARDAIEPAHFASWADWACGKGIALDFNTTFFSHPLAENGTLSNADEGVRSFWIEHGVRCREIASYLGKRTGKLSYLNHWIPDGSKEIPADTLAPRRRLIDSLDKILAKPAEHFKDAVESKLFGIGAEAYTPGSHEFYLAYAAARRNTLLTLDAGHFHPTEVISAKISSALCFVDELVLHVSRPVRWDSDHVVLYDDETRQIMREIVRCDALARVHIGTDYFDASINRIAAWVIGGRNTHKALLAALLEPAAELKRLEAEGDRTASLALSQELLTMPVGAVWDYYCEKNNIPGADWIKEVKAYEKNVLSARG